MTLSRWYWSAAAAVTVLTLLYYHYYTANLLGPPSGRTPEGLALGILGFAAMLGALLYSARRRWIGRAMRRIAVDADARKDLKTRERRALEQLQALQRQALRNPAGNPGAIRQQAKQILKDNGVTRYIRARVTGGRGQGVRLEISRREWVGRLETWYYWHLILGCLSVVLILTHAGFRFGNLIATLAFVFLVGVVATGILGYFIYWFIPPALTKVEERVEKTPEELREELNEVNQELEGIVQGKSALFREIYAQETSIPGVSLRPSWRWVFGPAEIQRDTARPDRLRLIVREIPGHEQEDFREMVRLIFQKEKLEVSLYPQLRYDYLLKAWLALHIPLTAGLMIFSVIHIVAILYY
ncbi:MAG: hypothetical protein AB1671_15080 [Thermodesulfobacteriota bacterium]|jgi:hypothetical protein